MRLTESPGRLVLSDTPGCIWVLGLAFVGSGTLVLTVPVFAPEWATFVWWERLAVLAIGASHLAAGLWTIRLHPATRLELDRARGAGLHRVRHPGQRAPTITTFRLTEVRDVALVESRDSDGDPVFALRLRLSEGREVQLQGHPAPGREQARGRADVLRRFLGLPALPP